MPALALAEELRARGREVSFVGVGGRAGSGIPERHGYPEDHVRLRGFDRRVSLRNLWSVVLAALAVPRMMRVLRRRRADVVVGGGGYMAGPTGWRPPLRSGWPWLFPSPGAVGASTW